MRGKTQEVLFRPLPFGDDIFAQFGDEFAIPIVGNFDPPTLPGVQERIFTNPDNPLDVNDDGHVTPRDALIAINQLNSHGSSTIEELTDDVMYVDTNEDGWVSARDVLGIVNYLNSPVEQATAADIALAALAGIDDDSGKDDEDEESL